MKLVKILFSICLIAFIAADVQAQFGRRGGNKTVTFEPIYDDPYDINKLFVGLQPVFGDVHVTNIVTGFGLDATYYLNDFMHFKANARFPYYTGTDFARSAAENAREGNLDAEPAIYPSFDGRTRSYLYSEFSAAYHIWDKEQDHESTVPLYSKNYEGAEWAAKVPQRADIANKRREILFARLGGMYYETTSEIGRAIEAQGVQVLRKEVNGNANDSLAVNGGSIYGNVLGGGLFVGGGFTWIKNFAAKPDRTYEELVDDHIFSVFMDMIIMPYVKVEDFFYNPSPETIQQPILYDASTINTFMFGGRLGIEGHFNRTLGWGYGAEIGIRPGVQKRGFYGLIKITFPMYGTKLDYKVEAFGR